MKLSVKRIILLILGVVLALNITVTVMTQKHQETQVELTQAQTSVTRLEDLNKKMATEFKPQIEALQFAKTSAEKHSQSLEAQLQSAKAEISQLQNALQAAQAETAALKAKLDKTKALAADLEKTISD